MSSAAYEILLRDVVGIFESILGVPGRPFGASNSEFRGVSDDAKGVQWNIAASMKSGEARLGVNLEGMKYKDWPIASFIEAERETMALRSLSKRIPHTDEIVISFLRDAWQRASRPNIAERHIGKGEVPLSALSKSDWLRMLDEAYDCLDGTKGHRGRAMQVVTKSTGQDEMEVSPHLYVYTQTSTRTASLRSEIDAAFTRLKPVYDMVKSESENQKPTRWKETLDTVLDAPLPPVEIQEQNIVGNQREGDHDREAEPIEVNLNGRVRQRKSCESNSAGQMTDNRQETIDAVVHSAYGGPAIQFELRDVLSDPEEWAGAEAEPLFNAVQPDQFNAQFSDDALAEYLGEDDGEVFSDDKRWSYARDHLLYQLHGEGDADCVPLVRVLNITDSAARRAVVAFETTGYSFSGIDEELIGVFQDRSSVEVYYRRNGYVVEESDLDEFRESILAAWTPAN